ncbi:MAG: hypothetical protein J6Y72_12365 [Bacteroidales bacterium]|nr:hypothetical protein [Bacteroidales bacterium]
MNKLFIAAQRGSMGVLHNCCPTLLATDYKGPLCLWIFTPIDNEPILHSRTKR